MVYYAVSVQGNEPSIRRLKTKDDVIDWLLMGFNPDNEAIVDTVSEAKEWIKSLHDPNYVFKRRHMEAS